MIEAVEPARPVRLPNDPLFAEQWHLHNTGQNGGTPGADIDLLAAWGLTRGTAEIIVAVLDTGIDRAHPDLRGQFLSGHSFVPGVKDWQDDNGHGTQMAGVIAAIADNGLGVSGICPGARLLPVKVANKEGHTVDPQVAKGIRWAVDHGTRVISLSLGTQDIPQMREAADYAFQHGVLIIAAAGNSGNARPPYPAPAMYPTVLAVGGSDHHDRHWKGSSYGHPNLVLAPSNDILTTTLGGTWGPGGCTSIAAAQVSGLAALIFSLRPDLGPSEVMDAIQRGCERVSGQKRPDRIHGWGRINCYRSLLIAQKM